MRWWLAIGVLGCAACATTDDTSPPSQSSGPGGAGMGPSSVSSGGDAAGGIGGDGGADVPPDGSWDHPFPLALPGVVDGDTTGGVAVADDYPCAIGTDESGPEVVYRVSVMDAGFLWARVDDVSGDAIDVDVHLLREADPESCVTRADMEAGAPVRPGDYWIAIDTWVDGTGMAKPGPFTLDVGLVTEAGDDCYVSPITCDGAIPPYVNGVPDEDPGDAGCPAGMARIDDFCIDRYEAMLAEVLPNDTRVAWSPYANPGDVDVVALSVAGVVPQGFITQVQAADACARAGKRLCGDGEWLRACQGASATTYPYGDVREPGVCNDARGCHPVIQYFETDDSFVWSQLDHPCISQLPEGLQLTGAHLGCSAGEGVFDMMGNLHEWTADPAGTFRGGFYVDTVINGPGCQYATTAHNVFHWDYSTGFRCCADP